MNKEIKKPLMANHNPTPLEALKKCEWSLGENGWLKYRRKDIEIVKKALIQVEEVLKAFKIIVEKDVDITCIKYFKTVEDYNVGFDKDQQLTQQEFRLTKKVVGKYDKK